MNASTPPATTLLRRAVLGALVIIPLAVACQPPPGGWGQMPQMPNFNLFGSAMPGMPSAPPAAAGAPATTTPQDPQPGATPTPAPTPAPVTQGQSSSSASCCVGDSQSKSFFSCPDASKAAQCVGQPFDLMSCLDRCGFGGGCDKRCLEKYGPQPQQAGCTRDASRDSTCR